MRFKVTIGIALLLLSLAGLLAFKGVLPERQGGPGPGREELLKKLSIETFDKKVSAPDFSLKDPAGNQVSLQGLKGKVIFLNFWATWCPPCRLEMPTMQRLYEKYGKEGLVILAVNFREGPDEVKAFRKEHQLNFTTLIDREAKVFGLYKAWSLPTTYLIGKNGEMVGKVIGYRDWHSKLAQSLFHDLLGSHA
ncbi:MAG: peroxiredoxin family protein [Candidatus Binatia bacterium]